MFSIAAMPLRRPCGDWVADQTVTLPSERTSATAQLGPIMPWFSNGVWYVAVNVLAADFKAPSTSPWLEGCVMVGAVAALARMAAGQSSVVGRPFQSDQVTGRAAA